MNVGEKIKRLRKEKDWNQKDLAGKLEVVQSSISAWEKSISEPNPKQRKKLCEIFGITEAELFSDYPPGVIIPGKLIKVPILGTAPAGDKTWSPEEIVGWIELPNIIVKGRKLYCIRIKGDSMEPELKNDALAIIHSETQPNNGDVVIAWVDEEVTIKRFLKKANVIILKSSNPKYEDQVYTHENDVKLRGIVKGVLW